MSHWWNATRYVPLVEHNDVNEYNNMKITGKSPTEKSTKKQQRQPII
jgi:hypothetical protein